MHVLNPEDIDPTIGRFRNLVSTTIIVPNKVIFELIIFIWTRLSIFISFKKRPANEISQNSNIEIKKLRRDSDDYDNSSITTSYSFDNVSKLGIKLPNLAPNIEKPEPNLNISDEYSDEFEPLRRKKYAKESWPGKKPTTLSSN